MGFAPALPTQYIYLLQIHSDVVNVDITEAGICPSSP